MSGTLAAPGRNCWRSAHADRVGLLVDADAHFAAVASACEKAERSITIVGWVIDSRVRLRRDGRPPGRRDELGPFLAALVKRKKGLRVRVLAWDFGMLFGLESGFLPVFRTHEGWRHRLEWELDSEHAFGAGQHQKLVVVDDRVAFVGGIDLTAGRWDTRAHLPDDPRRTDGGEPHGPHHDCAIVMDGDAAAAIAELAHERWTLATGRGPFARLRESLPQLDEGHIGRTLDRVTAAARRVRARARGQWQRVSPPARQRLVDPWPDGVEPSMHDVTASIARTEAAYLDRPDVRENEQLWVDAIGAARRTLFIENQYFTSRTIAQAIASRLAEPDGPEVVIIQPLSCAGWLEEVTMGILRDQALTSLREADLHGRLRAYHPVSGGVPVYVHSKVLVVDDALLRVGSANVANRSLQLDTECDIAIESAGREDLARATTLFRDGLVAEHLGVEPAQVSRAVAATGSLGGAIDSLRGGERTLEPLAFGAPGWLAALVPTGIADPERAEPPEALSRRIGPRDPDTVSPWARARGLALVAVLTVLAAAWTLTPIGLGDGARTLAELVAPWHEHPLAPVAALAVFVLAGLVAFPISVLVLACDLAFGPWVGSLVSLVGCLVGAAVTYVEGRAIGRRWVRRLGGTRLNRLSRLLADRGVIAVALARLLPFVPFTLTGLVAGASHVRPLDYVVGTILGILPGILAAALIGDAAARPGLRGLVELVVFALLVTATYFWARARLRHTERGT